VRLAFFPALLMFAAGCGGINASKSVSPLDFLMPGLLRAEPGAPSNSVPTGPLTAPVRQVAQN